MKSTAIIIFIMLNLMISDNVLSQQIIAEAEIQFNLNDTFWMRVTTPNDKTNTSTIYRYRRQPVQTIDGRQVIPSISVIVEPVPDTMEVMTFAGLRRAKTPLEIEEFIPAGKGMLTFLNAVGYRGGYTDKTGTRHTTTIIYLINENMGIQMILDINTELWNKYRQEFEDVIRSIESI